MIGICDDLMLQKICKDYFFVFATRFQTRNCFQTTCMRCVVFFVWIR